MAIKPLHIYVAVGLLLLALAGHAYLTTVRNTAQAEQAERDVKEQIAGLRGELKDALDQIAKDRSEAKTPQQIAQRLPRYIDLPAPIYAPVPVTAPPGLPDAPSAVAQAAPAGSLVIPAESVTAFWKHETQCKEDQLSLAECQKEIPLLTKRAEIAEKAMKGGGFWKRAKANSKWFILGAAAGAATGAILKH